MTEDEARIHVEGPTAAADADLGQWYAEHLDDLTEKAQRPGRHRSES